MGATWTGEWFGRPTKTGIQPDVAKVSINACTFRPRRAHFLTWRPSTGIQAASVELAVKLEQWREDNVCNANKTLSSPRPMGQTSQYRTVFLFIGLARCQ